MRDENHKLIQGIVEGIKEDLVTGTRESFDLALALLRPVPQLNLHQHLIPIMTRVYMRDYWLNTQQIDGWTIGGNPRKTSQLILFSDEHPLELRVLKEHLGIQSGGVPPAGCNTARRTTWSNPPLLRTENEPTLMDGLPPGDEPGDRLRLLLLWDFQEHSESEGFSPNLDDDLSIRVVHPIAPGRWGSPVPIDLSIDLTPNWSLPFDFGDGTPDNALHAVIDGGEFNAGSSS